MASSQAFLAQVEQRLKYRQSGKRCDLKPISMLEAHFDLDFDRSSYSEIELLKYYDEEFIECIYRALLKRRPDQFALEVTLESLRQGHVSRQDLIAEIERSDEAKKHNVIIQRSRRRSLLIQLEQRPLIQRCLALLGFDQRFISRRLFSMSTRKRLDIAEGKLATLQREQKEINQLLVMQVNTLLNEINRLHERNHSPDSAEKR